MADSAMPDDFSVLVLASDLGVDARPFLSHSDKERISEIAEDQENWYDCPSFFDEDFSDLHLLQFIQVHGSDKHGNRIVRIVGKYFPGFILSNYQLDRSLIEQILSSMVSLYLGSFVTALEYEYAMMNDVFAAQVISAERLKKYVFYKIFTEVQEGPFCILYIHSTVQKEDNSPGMTILRWIYEDLPADVKDRLQTVYFLHPGLRSRLAFATLGRFFLTGNLYWKIKYASRLQYLWEDIRQGEVEIPEFVKEHDDVLEHRPLTDYGIEPDPHHLNEMPAPSYTFGRYQDRWTDREYTS